VARRAGQRLQHPAPLERRPGAPALDPATSGADNLHTLKLVFAAYESRNRQGGRHH
jgi:hypothetical protein